MRKAVPVVCGLLAIASGLVHCGRPGESWDGNTRLERPGYPLSAVLLFPLGMLVVLHERRNERKG
jgi:hypothetical protein